MSFESVSTIIQGFIFISAFAAGAASLLMFQVTRKFGTGILASGFKNIAVGVIFIAVGIILDALASYFQVFQSGIYTSALFFLKGLCFLIGTYIIVIGSKKTADKLESLTK